MDWRIATSIIGALPWIGSLLGKNECDGHRSEVLE